MEYKKVAGFTPLHPESPVFQSNDERQIKIKSSRKPCPLGRGVTGFTLVEIMIVVTIIALLASIAIPNLLRQRILANESKAQATLKTIATACESFAAANNGDYPLLMTDLTAPAAGPAYLNEDYTAAASQGYNFAIVGALAATGYTFGATPVGLNTTGTRSFSICTGAILREALGGAAPACP